MADPGAPRTWVAGETVTDTLMNSDVRDQLNYVRDAMLMLNLDTSTTGNVGSGEDDLTTYSLPADTLSSNGMGVKITAFGATANNANAKTLKLYFGSTVLGSLSLTTNSASGWIASAIVIRTGAATQAGYQLLLAHGTGFDKAGGVTAPTETLSGAVTIKCTGEATADDDITQTLLMVQHLR